ncbi:MAG: hypothetical protein IKV53_06405 [Clostridia bacterium]|nr:hypothetical protein [Clostridia bacterium]
MKKQFKNFKNEIKAKKGSFTVYVILRMIVLLILIRSFFRADYEGMFYCVLTLILFFLPSLLAKRFKIELPSALESIIFIFIFSAEILGELNSAYITIPHFDTALHTVNGFICAAFGFALVDMLNRGGQKISLSPLYLCIVAFCFSMTIGVLWEFFEFFMDTVFARDMQKDTVISVIRSVKLHPEGKNIPVTLDGITSVTVNGRELGLGGYLDIGLYDTMKDLLVNFVGAVVFCFIGYFSLKGRKSQVVEGLVPKTVDN